MSFPSVKKELELLEKKELIHLIGELYKISSPVKEYLEFYAQPDEDNAYKIARQRIHESFYPQRGFGYKLKEAKEAITRFKRLSPSTEQYADILLYYVECGVQYTLDFGDMNEAFYSSLEGAYSKALAYIARENLREKFHDRSYKLVKDTEDMGWGFHDFITGEHYSYYS